MRELLFLLFATKSESCSTKVYVTSPSIWLRCPAPIATAWAGLRQRITWVQQARGRIKFFAARDRLAPRSTDCASIRSLSFLKTKNPPYPASTEQGASIMGELTFRS